MKITKVSYGKTYSLGNYCSERIDLEATIDKEEDIQFVVCNLKHECDEIHKKNNPHLYQEQETVTFNTPIKTVYGLQVTEPQEVIPSKKLSHQELISQEIDKSDTLKKLKELELLSKKYPETKELWRKKYDIFCDTTPTN